MEALLQDKNLKRICIIIILSLWAWSVIGNNAMPVASSSSLIQAAPGDSIGIKTIEGKSFVIYQMGKGETAYAVSRKFNVPYKDIAAANSGVDMGALKIGQQILVPIYLSTTLGAVSNTTVANTQKDEIKSSPVVLPPDVAQNNSSVTDPANEIKPEEIKSTENNATENTSVTNTSIITENTSSAQSGEKTKSFAMLYAEYQSESMIAVSEKGAATWIENNNIETGDRFYALSNTAPVGSIIKVRNMMNNRVVFAKVIGKLSESEVNQKVMVKLSAGAGERLNVLDNRFVVEVTYYKNEE